VDPKRAKAEKLIYAVFDKLDPSGANSDFYKKRFAKMNDAQFKSYISKEFPFRFQTRLFKIEPNMVAINEAANVLGYPIMERVNLPYLYKDENGKAVQSKECMVVYANLKRMKQFITKKNSMSIDINMRDMKTGLLISDDKNGKTSDREMEALAVMGLDQTMRELARPRADAMNAKSEMYSTISTTGMVSLNDLPDDVDDSLAKNLLNVYMLGSGLDTNLLNVDGYLPITLKNKQPKVVRK
jgi:hypothetical protein